MDDRHHLVVLQDRYAEAQQPLSCQPASHRTDSQWNCCVKRNPYSAHHLLANGHNGHGKNGQGGEHANRLRVKRTQHIHHRLDDDAAPHSGQRTHGGCPNGNEKIEEVLHVNARWCRRKAGF